jgi:glutamine amidotransferase-like uncharacterized protein
LIPGGMAPRHSDEIRPEGRAQVERFLRAGGGYLGICAGAYIACQPDPGSLRDFGYTPE